MTKIEEAARAAYADITRVVEIVRPGSPFIKWDSLPEEQRQIMLSTLRAALKVLREPSEAMTSKCWSATVEGDGEGGCWIGPSGTADLWRSMIDAILEENG